MEKFMQFIFIGLLVIAGSSSALENINYSKICTQCRMSSFSHCNETGIFDFSSVVFCEEMQRKPCLVGIANITDSMSMNEMQIMCLLNATKHYDKEILESNGIKVTLVKESISIPDYITANVKSNLHKPVVTTEMPDKHRLQGDNLPTMSLEKLAEIKPKFLDDNALGNNRNDDNYQAVASEIKSDIEASLKRNDKIPIKKAIEDKINIHDDIPNIHKAQYDPNTDDLVNTFIGPPDKRRCFDCDSHFDDDCMDDPKDIVVCKFGMGVANGCFTIYKADANQTIRGCVVENAEEILSYCRINADLCHLCYEQQCNDRVMDNFALNLKPFTVNLFIGILIATHFMGTGRFVSV